MLSAEHGVKWRSRLPRIPSCHNLPQYKFEQSTLDASRENTTPTSKKEERTTPSDESKMPEHTALPDVRPKDPLRLKVCYLLPNASDWLQADLLII